MKSSNFVSAVVATASTLFIVGTIAQKTQVKDFGLGIFLGISFIKRQTDIHERNSLANNVNKLQNEVSFEVASLSRSQKNLENTKRELSEKVERIANSKKIDRTIKRITKIEKRLASQEKQQNKIRSLFDKLNYHLKDKTKTKCQPRSSEKNSNHLVRFTKITSQIIAQQPTTHVYIDGNNFKCTTYRLNFSVDYQALKSYLIPTNGKIRLNFYNGICHLSRFKQNRFHSYLKQLGYNVVTLPKRIHPDGTHKTVGDDVSMAIDILEKVKSGDRLIIISGDGDFFPVIKKIQQRQVKVTAIGCAKSTSDITRRQVDEFVNLENLRVNLIKEKY